MTGVTGGFGAWIRAETKRARIGDARIESDFLGKGELKNEGRRDSADHGQETTRPAGGPGPATVHGGGKREQTARELRAARFGRGATDFASPRAPGSPISRGRVKGTAPTPGGQGPATARRGGKREQTARESRAARFGREATDSRKPRRPLRSSISGDRVKRTAPPPAAPVPRQRAAEESENKRRANCGAASWSRRDGNRKPRSLSAKKKKEGRRRARFYKPNSLCEPRRTSWSVTSSGFR